ncbi:MAG: winged helix-turn-helix domain-containing protein [Paracoccaceae bacterium]|jgi:DNA-binding transcriptional ArsR family regulator|nr:winged helix-turn-helix domain-containing protein [Paracoccaceae bacterium]
MREGPDIARIGALIGDPARANMLTALMSGKALTATELAAEAGVTAQTASAHLSKLAEAGLTEGRKQGRHRYFTLADDEVGAVLEAVMGLAAKRGHLRTRTGPKDPALREARVCYNHLAGEMGVRLYDSMLASGGLQTAGEDILLTDKGDAFAREFGVDLDNLNTTRRPMCRPCLDWSARRTHLAGALGQALLTRITDLGWAKREPESRIIAFSTSGKKAFESAFPL